MSKIQQTLALILIGMIAALSYWFITLGTTPGSSWQRGKSVRSTATGLWLLQWGYRDGKVEFLAFVHNGVGEPKELITSNGNPSVSRPTLSIPGQPPVACPPNFNVFQYVDGKYDQQNIPLTVEQAQKYCVTTINRYTIETLKEFLAKGVIK